MTPTMLETSEAAGFLHAICANPADDTARLVYADWLDEQGPERVCPDGCTFHKKAGYFVVYEEAYPLGVNQQDKKTWFRCGTCSGSGTVLDTSRQERAEFIRLSIELANKGGAHVPHCERYADRMGCDCLECARFYHNYPLKKRADDLLATHGEEWARPVAEVLGCKRWGNAGVTGGPNVAHAGWTFARGFVSAVSLPTSTFLTDLGKREPVPGGGDCPECRGKGTISTSYIDKPFNNRQVDTGPCSHCSGTGRRHRGASLAARLVRASPVTEIRLSDRKPDETALASVPFIFWREVGAMNPKAWVPAVLFDSMSGEAENHSGVVDWHKHYATAEAAHFALSRAAVTLAWREAGLPPLSQPQDRE